MAKVKVLFGQMRGKIGGTVFRHDPDGYTVASEYNPTPANPRTWAQTTQRNKMNLAGQLSKIVPYEAIAGLSTSRRKARSEFVSNTIHACAGSRPTPGSTSAESTVTLDKLIFSKGSMVPVGATIAMNENGDIVTVTPTGWAEVSNLLGIRVIALGLRNGKWTTCDVKTTSTNTAVTFDYTAIIGAQDALTVAVYIVPVIDNGNSASTVYGMLTGAHLNPSVNAHVTRQLAALDAFAASVYVGNVTNVS